MELCVAGRMPDRRKLNQGNLHIRHRKAFDAVGVVGKIQETREKDESQNGSTEKSADAAVIRKSV